MTRQPRFPDPNIHGPDARQGKGLIDRTRPEDGATEQGRTEMSRQIRQEAFEREAAFYTRRFNSR